MCGIVGYWGGRASTPDVVENMARKISSRGPDDSGVWLDKTRNLALAHRRLSILDLSAAGHQPMRSINGRFVLSYNGEIYNHQELRTELKAEGCTMNWRSHSDTETLLEALCHWGIEGALQRLNGMFSFALWDSQERTLFLARDRMGEKPLYYGRIGNVFLFGSELKAMTAHPDWGGKIDRNALALYMRHNYVPTPWSIFRGISKLPPAHFVVIRDDGYSIAEPKCYWNLGNVAEQGLEHTEASPEELMEALDRLLCDAVRRRMMADVPLGAFLSGGYDSTTVVALMQSQSMRPVKTFSIGFYEQARNEAGYAKAVAEHLGTEHTELYVTPEEAMAVIPKLPIIYDEPFSDSSQIPTYLVSKLARKHVKVSLSGDGGDELFFGYDRYMLGYRMWQKLRFIPRPLRRSLSFICAHAPGHVLNTLQRLFPRRARVTNLADRLPKFAEILDFSNEKPFYRGLISHTKNPSQLVRGSTEPDTILSRLDCLPDLPGLREQMMYLDMMTYLPDDILVKLDRASMAVGLEARVPLLDHRVVEFAWRVPTRFKYREGQGKWLLRQVLYRYIPRELVDRPKMGFGVPLEHWLRNPLREWAEELLDMKRLRDEGFFDPAPIRNMWKEHLSGQRRWHHHLWNVLMFQAWLSAQKA